MSLSQSNLKSAIEDALNSYPDNTTDSANALAKAYADYFAEGIFGSSTPTLTGQESAMAATLLTGMVGVLATWTLAIQNAVVVFQTGIPVAGASGAGVTVPSPTALTIAVTLTPALSAFPASTSDAATIIATALHTGTMGCTASLLLPPSPTPVVTPIA
jgi:hypothetical protein